ncbi:MAG: rRNA maturation RNase YbeY [Alphaproteobacteria bacterium]|nr:rRNA maturation RNase YbeY [Alphaproteobacteria bacterium]
MNLEISIEHKPWNRSNIRSIVNTCVNAVFSELNLNHYNVEICFLFTNDEEVQVLNRTYRGIDKPTNVLSFPADNIDDIESDCGDVCCCDNFGCNICILGSVALAYETVEREVEDTDISFDDHLKHLIIHSVLHLLGYDHIGEAEAEQMESLEIKILKSLNVADPYQ